ncbi:MAG: helix-turn-helix domain-containing protein [Sulfitobacter sp.]
MKKADATRERLLTHARRLMWARGYGAVSLREVAQAAGVDVALVSRYFGSKKGLFEATLQDAFAEETLHDMTPDDLVFAVVQIFVSAPRGGADPSSMRMIVMNADDEEVGDLVRAAQAEQLQTPLTQMLGSPARAALFMAACLGLSVAEKSLHLDGIAPVGSDTYEAQVRQMLEAALAFEA